MPSKVVPTARTRFVDAKYVAEVLLVSKMTVYRLVETGELAGFRVGRLIRIPIESVWELMDRVKVHPETLQHAGRSLKTRKGLQ